MISLVTGCHDIDECQLDSRFDGLVRYYSRTFADSEDELNTLSESVTAAGLGQDMTMDCSVETQNLIEEKLPDSKFEGVCDSRSPCFNREGAFECGSCPDGYFGSALESIVWSTIASRVGSGCTDTDECVSGPCANGAICVESIVDTAVSPDAYRCTCTPGYANGVCQYDYISEYDQECNVLESSANAEFGVGNCDMDVDECRSRPCTNAASCTESSSDIVADDVSTSGIPMHAYQCACAIGFANGTCAYDFISEYTAQCDQPLGGNCDVDVNECSSGPCYNNAPCLESNVDGEVPAHAFRCICTPGWAEGEDGACDKDFNECEPNPCVNKATCTDSGSLPAANKTIFDECGSAPCQNSAVECTDEGGSYTCTCSTGSLITFFSQMEIDVLLILPASTVNLLSYASNDSMYTRRLDW